MKILQINSSDYGDGGGGAIAMYRLAQGLRASGLDCKILSGIKTTDLDWSRQIHRKPKIEARIRKWTSRLGLNDLHCVSSFELTTEKFYLDADIINFHVIHSNFFNYLALSKLTQSRPGIFTLHDMWSFTGHCAYSYDCTRWKTGCGQCPYPNTYPLIHHDGTSWEWKLKNWTYSRSDLTIVTPSHWLTEQAKSSMLNRFDIHHIPYGISTSDYQPLDPELCRVALGISQKKKVLLFSAVDLKDARKGGDLLVKALTQLPNTIKQDCVLLTLGSTTHQLASAVDLPVINLGYVSSDRLKSVVYSAADLFLLPTRADNLPLVLQESMACGTPMVSFDIGGVSDLVRPGITGYLAQAENVDDFCKGIIDLLDDDVKRQAMGKNCRHIALEEYSLDLQAKRYSHLYQQVLKERVDK
ncbi:glycosyltransferase [Nodosilinea sp. FACHB-13]|uniref:glycosyltransferase n=1 Tax=Nodosilinea sp. FACHB-13 TaxID=2692831 RepID=UPI00168483E1|nr:glycosyltransferase [Nodosilinea sp. FACHB-13]